MFKTLVKHNIINYNGQYVCYLCMCIKASLEDILYHINREEHMIARCDQIFKMFKHYNITETYQEITNKSKTAYVIAEYSFICIPCRKSFKDLRGVLQHIECANHIRRWRKNIINFDEINSIIMHPNNKFKHKLEIHETNVFDIKLLLQNLIAYQEYDSYINEYDRYLCMSFNITFKAYYNFKKLYNCYEILVNNKIILSEHYTFNHVTFDKGTYTCDLCMCSLRSFDHILPHIRKKSHKALEDQNMKKYNYKMNKIEKELDCDQIQHEVSDTTKCKISTSSVLCNKDCLELIKQKLIDNRIKCFGIIFLCTVCNCYIVSLHNILKHTEGKSHKHNFAQNANLDTYESGTNTNNTTDISENHSSINDIYNVDYNTSKVLKNTISLRDDSNENKIFTDIYESNRFTINNIHTVKLNKLSSDNQCDFAIIEDVCVQIINILSDKQISKIHKPKKKSLNILERLNELYTEKYLKIEKKMYTVQEKLNNIKINLRLIMPYDSTHFYCIACNQKVPEELYFVYEHICLQQHKMQINQIKKDINCDKLSSQYMKEISKYEVKCYPCGNFVKNDMSYFTSHIKEKCHREKHEKLTKVIDAIFDSISQDVNNLWYSIQRFCCALCSERFDHKIEFVKHIDKQHSPLLEDQIFDFCIPCTVLWLGNEDCYTKHCNDKLHKYLLKSKDFMIEDFPDSIKEILIQADEVSNVLFQQSDLLDSVPQEIKQSLEYSLKSVYPTIKVFVFGSRVTGLALVDSDIDIYLDCNNTYNQEVGDDKLAESYLRTIKERLPKNEWEIREIVEKTRIPIMKLTYKRNGLHCDISVTNGLSVENSKLIRSFNDAYLPCRKLILFVKKWLSNFNLPGRHGLINYALSCLVIFYLQTESYLPSVAELIKEKNNSKLISGWETGVAQPKDNNKSEQPISTLLLGFFKFYANFDYRHYIICPLMGKLVAKKDFTDIKMLPEEMKPYINYLQTSEKPQYFRIDSPLCVQDPFDLSHNLTKAVTNITLKYFKQYCQDSSSFLLSLIK
ncbi:uncharacterized protein LOC122533255 [Frieseomelitta varia]|uniref:uncharacterized protein LOC122533255 n=1 Tax=Frieseomelitta varia TaxID=561572 RepID=UPI001CB691F7|nr:uncharacterized protein LOC122533255 [Frieseomelitta varia]